MIRNYLRCSIKKKRKICNIWLLKKKKDKAKDNSVFDDS